MGFMNEHEKTQIAIERYANLQRIKKYGQEELEYQERIARAELRMWGISVEDLEIKEKAGQNDFPRRK